MSDATTEVGIDMTGVDLARLIGRASLPAELRDASGIARLDWILSLPDVTGFVAGLATEELYLLMTDIGTTDSYPLLAHATGEQMSGIMDLHLWSGNEVELTRWVSLLELAETNDLETAFRFVRATDAGVIELLFKGDVEIFASDLDIDLVPDTHLTIPSPDGVFWAVVDREHALADGLHRLLKLLWGADMDRMRDIATASRFDLPSNIAEELIRWRAGRLQDLGFPSPEEAKEIYTRLDPRARRAQVRAELSDLGAIRPASLGSVAQDIALQGARTPQLLGAALAKLDDESRERFGQAFTFLVNKIFMAETQDLSQTDDLPVALEQALATTNLGLAWLADEDLERASLCLQRLWPVEIFQVGWSLGRDLGARAVRLGRRAGVGVSSSLFGPPTSEILSGLRGRTPRMYEALTKPGAVGWRFIATAGDLSLLDAHVAEAERVVRFFEERLQLDIEKWLSVSAAEGLDQSAVHFETLLRTAVANALLAGEASLEPLTREDLASFLSVAIADGVVSPRLRAVLQDAVPSDAASELLAGWVMRSFDELALALGRVSASELEPQYVSGLMLTVPTQETIPDDTIQ